MSCPICGMPPRDGEPCCTREYAIRVVRQQDAKIRGLESQLAEARAELERLRAAVEAERKRYLPFALEMLQDAVRDGIGEAWEAEWHARSAEQPASGAETEGT